MKKRLADILAKLMYHRYKAPIRVCGIDLARFDREHFHFNAIVCVAGYPPYYLSGDWNKETDSIIYSIAYWRGEIIE